MSCAWFRFASLVPHRGRFSLYHSDLCLFKPEICQSPVRNKGFLQLVPELTLFSGEIDFVGRFSYGIVEGSLLIYIQCFHPNANIVHSSRNTSGAAADESTIL